MGQPGHDPWRDGGKWILVSGNHSAAAAFRGWVDGRAVLRVWRGTHYGHAYDVATYEPATGAWHGRGGLYYRKDEAPDWALARLPKHHRTRRD